MPLQLFSQDQQSRNTSNHNYPYGQQEQKLTGRDWPIPDKVLHEITF